MPTSTFVEMPMDAPAAMLAALRRARRLPAGPPHRIATVLFGSRSRVDHTVRASREGCRGREPDDHEPRVPPVRRTMR